MLQMQHRNSGMSWFVAAKRPEVTKIATHCKLPLAPGWLGAILVGRRPHMANVIEKPRPIELCLERVRSSSADRYVRCTAQVGRAMGLALGVDGRILWREQSGVGCEIWVSADQRLMAWCPPGTPPTTLYRAGRVLQLPRERPVVLRHHDELELAATRFRVHVHGVTNLVHAPAIVRTLARAAAAATLALAVGGSAGCGGLAAPHPDATAADATAAPPDARDVPTFTLKFDAAVIDQAGVDGAGIEAEEPADAPIEVLDFPPFVY
jgi:hypothetical protein